MNLLKVFSCVALMLVFFSIANANVVDFDDVYGGTSHVRIPDGYMGFDWGTLEVMYQGYLPNTGYQTGVTSGNYAAFNAWGHVAVIDDGLFDFTGAYLTPAFVTISFDYLELEVKGYSAGNLEYSTTITLDSLTPTWVTFDYLNIDTLSFASIAYRADGSVYSDAASSQFVMDDFTFIPEPTTLLLLGLGGLMLRRKR